MVTPENSAELSWQDRQEVQFQANRIFRHKVLRVNYTSYDLRRSQDSMNPRTQPDVMLPALDFDPDTGISPSGHPFAYARILGVFHADIIHSVFGLRPKAHSMEFLWVRWYRLDKTFTGGLARRRLHRMELVPETDPSAFGFIDPDDVIRGVHLIPAFAHGSIPSTSSYPSNATLWKFYYVNMYVSPLTSLTSIQLIFLTRFVDRDMYMRFRVGGVGHSVVPIKNHDPPTTDNSDCDDEDVEETLPPILTTPADTNTSDTEGDSGSDSEEEGPEEEPDVGETEGSIDEDEDFDPEDGEGDIVDVENEEGFDAV